MKSVVIITPTTGSKELVACVESVQEQTYKNVRHLLVIDGPENCANTYDQLNAFSGDELVLPQNVGGNGWYGHRVFAALPYLVDEDVVMFLDQDNWFMPNHVETMMKTLDKGADWAYSLRIIREKDDGFLCYDNCESLGKWPAWPAHKGQEPYYHIDTSCFAIPREILVRGICGAWYGKWGADRQFFNILKQHYPSFGCTGQHTVNYRLAGNEGSVKPEFFLEGNKIMSKIYDTVPSRSFPWQVEVNV